MPLIVCGVVESSVTATKKRYHDQVEADMAEMSSMSKSEIRAVIEEQALTKRKQLKFLDLSSSTQGEVAGVQGGCACRASAFSCRC